MLLGNYLCCTLATLDICPTLNLLVLLHCYCPLTVQQILDRTKRRKFQEPTEDLLPSVADRMKTLYLGKLAVLSQKYGGQKFIYSSLRWKVSA